MGKLDGKVAIITGAGRGHAEAVARRLAREGAAVSICDVIPAIELEDSVGSKTNGGKVLCFQTDVSKEGQVNKMVEETIEHFGSVEAAMPILEHMYGGVAVYGTDLYIIEDPQEARKIIQKAGLE